MSAVKFYGISRGGAIVPATHWAGTQLDELPQGIPLLITVSGKGASQRTIEQNDKMHAMISDVRRHIPYWHGHKLSVDDWKCIFTASLKQQRLVPGIDNSLVVLGTKTSHMGVNAMIDMIELITSWGLEQGITFREPAEVQG